MHAPPPTPILGMFLGSPKAFKIALNHAFGVALVFPGRGALPSPEDPRTLFSLLAYQFLARAPKSDYSFAIVNPDTSTPCMVVAFSLNLRWPQRMFLDKRFLKPGSLGRSPQSLWGATALNF